MTGPTPDFWQNLFDQNATRWDRGGCSPQLLAWLDSGALAPCRIAVPGCGGGWEVAELARRGFEVIGIDYTPAAVERTRALLAEQGLHAEVVQADVLQWQPAAPLDAVYEQTCLCALHPDLWTGYAQQLHRWVRPGGTLFALFMQMVRPGAVQEGLIEGPPYHCDINAMRALFPGTQWHWPKPPYPQVKHPNLSHELVLPLTRI
ncbi:MAG: methyltransferase domain-containing protein [Proteobacteria bacterium]|uniref:methyltransferase domain-containing protein n=1 Tax=Aquabacterium sp. TaxID=1872578 RepID=UPI0035C67143|nr:methyltransferase domain-containing protein [Pseudomonadota bacterium]